MTERDRSIEDLAKELADAEGISLSELRARIGPTPQFRTSVGRLAPNAPHGDDILQRQLDTALKSSYPGPACLRPHEVDDLRERRLPESRRRHALGCEGCRALLLMIAPAADGYRTAMAAVGAAGASEPLLEPWSSTTYAITATIGDVEGHPDRRAQLRQAVEAAQALLPADPEFLIVTADQLEWPQWAVECLPTLCASYDAGGEVRVLLWHYIAECLEREDIRVSDAVTLCGGIIIDAGISERGRQVLDVVSPHFEKARLAVPHHSIESITTAVMYAVQQVETQLAQSHLPTLPRVAQLRDRLLEATVHVQGPDRHMEFQEAADRSGVPWLQGKLHPR